MQKVQTLKALRESFGFTQTQIAKQMGNCRMTYNVFESDPNRIPRQETIERLRDAFNNLLSGRGSEARLTYDDLWRCILATRGLAPSGHPNVAADLAAIDHPAQESA